MKIKISADSTCDLTRRLVEENNISILPLYIICDETSYRDGVNISADDVFRWTQLNRRPCSTSAVNVADYQEAFCAWRKEYDAVIHFTISSEMSSCYLNATTAAKEIPGVFVVDSRNLSTGIGHLVLDACEMAAAGMDAQVIFDTLEQKKKMLDVSFVLDTLEYLRYGGRCSSLAAFGANLLHLKPSIQVHDGTMGVGRKYRGSLKKCMLDYVADKLAEPETVDARRVFITDSGVDEEISHAVEEAVLAHVPFERVIHTRAGCTISGHCGPNCLGILFYRNCEQAKPD